MYYKCKYDNYIISNFQYTDEDFQVSTELIQFQLEFLHSKINKSFRHESFSELSVFFSFFILFSSIFLFCRAMGDKFSKIFT